MSPDLKARFELAAQLESRPLSDFVVEAAGDRAEHVIRKHGTPSSVPGDFDFILRLVDEANSTKAVRRYPRLEKLFDSPSIFE